MIKLTRWRSSWIGSTRAIEIASRYGVSENLGRQRITGDGSPCLKLVFGMRALPYCDKKFSGFAADHATYLQGVAKVGMAAPIERAGQSDSWPHRKQPTLAMQSCHRSRRARASRRLSLFKT
jgi:hypothetical protein